MSMPLTKEGAADLIEHASKADNESELFEVVNAQNEPIELALRSRVHREGLAHRATHVFLFQPSTGDLLLQRRSPHKKIAAGLWDLSCAEHNSPGETYCQAAVRGLNEELGIDMDEKNLKQARPVFFHRAVYADDFVECEHIGTFCAAYDGIVKPDGNEVTETAFWPIERVLSVAKERPFKFSPWMLLHLASINLEQLSRFTCE